MSSSAAPEKTVESEASYKLGGNTLQEAVAYEIGVSGTTATTTTTTKRGHKCCGGCCDVRRATIIVNIVNIGLEILALLGVLLISKGMEAMADADDDSVKAAVEEFESISLNAGFFIFVVFRIIASGCGIGGAYYYNPTLVTVAGISYFALALTSLAYFDIAGVIYFSLFAYPHYYLVKEIREGIMSKDNYINEQHSCCCV